MRCMAAMRRARRNELTQGQQRWRSTAGSIGRVAARIARQYIRRTGRYLQLRSRRVARSATAPPMTARLPAVTRLARVAAAAMLLAAAGAQAQTLPTPQPAPTEAQQVEKLLRDGQPAQALARADAQLAKSPRNVQLRFLRAVALADLGRAPDAAAALEAMTQEFPELPEPYNNLAVLQAATGQYERARTLLLRAIEVAPNYVTARENLGDLHLAIAADTYARALALDPENAALKAKLAAARDAAGRLKAAR